MDPVIYSASPFQAFLGTIGMIAFLLLLGVVGAFWAIFKRDEAAVARIAMGGASIVLLVAALATSAFSVMRALNGDKTVAVVLDEKKVVTSNCDNGTCKSYLLETHEGQKYYDFTVAKSAFDKAEAGACYQMTYYPSSSTQGDSNGYETASIITRIERVIC